MTLPRIDWPPRRTALIAGVFYLLTFVTGITALVASGRLQMVAGLGAGVFYVAVTLLFYFIFRPVNRPLSLIAAIVSLAGCAIGPLAGISSTVASFHVNPLAFFGVYCLLIGYLVFNSTFMPRILGLLMAFGGLGWLTFAAQPLVDLLYPYSMVPGILGEGVLTLWLLVKGVDAEKWEVLAGARTPLA